MAQQDVGEFLSAFDLEAVAEAFRVNEYATVGDLLEAEIDGDDLRELGIAAQKKRKLVLKALASAAKPLPGGGTVAGGQREAAGTVAGGQRAGASAAAAPSSVISAATPGRGAVAPEPEPEPEPELKATLRELESKLQGLQSTPGAVAATAPARRAEEEAQRNLMSRKRSAAAKAKAQQRKAEPEPEPEPGKFSGAYWWLAVAGVLIAVAVSALAAAFSAELMALAADGMQATQSLTGVTDGRLNDMRATMRAAERSRLSSPEQELLEMADAREAERAQRIAATLDARRAKLGVDDEAQRSEAEREKHRDKQKAAYEASLIRRKANPAAAAAATATAAATAAGGGMAQQQQQEEGDPPAPVVQKAEPERGAQIATTNGCVCMPVTYDRSDPSDPREWHGCGAAGWCDVQPGCANAQQPRMPLYHGRDDCRLLQQ